jgi:hypothetical protein
LVPHAILTCRREKEKKRQSKLTIPIPPESSAESRTLKQAPGILGIASDANRMDIVQHAVRTSTRRYLPALALRSFLFLPIKPPILLPALLLSPAASGGVTAALSDLPPVRAFLLGRSPVSPSPDFSRRGLPLPSLGGLDSRLTAGRPSSSESSSVGRDLRLRSGAPPPCRASPTFSTRRLTTCRT